MMALTDLTLDQLKAERPDLVTALQTEVAQAEVNAAETAVAGQVAAESAREGSDLSALAADVAALKAENAQLKAGALVRTALQESGLSDLGKEMLMERFAGVTGPTLEVDVAAAVTKFATLEKKLTESARPRGVPILSESAGGTKFNIMADLRTISHLPADKAGG